MPADETVTVVTANDLAGSVNIRSSDAVAFSSEEDAAPGRPSLAREPPLPPGGFAMKSIDRSLTMPMIQARTPASLRALEPSRELLGTWMIWNVCRLCLNDPELIELNFTCLSMPAPEHQPWIMRQLVTHLGDNTHIERLRLSDSNLRGAEQARLLAKSLRKNRSLRVLNIESNALGPADLQCIIEALASNNTLEEFRCCNQFAAPIGPDVFTAAAEMLEANRTLCVLGMDITDRHYLDRVNKALIQNADAPRRRRMDPRAEAALPAPLQCFRRTATDKRQHCLLEDEDDKENADANREECRGIAAGLLALMHDA